MSVFAKRPARLEGETADRARAGGRPASGPDLLLLREAMAQLEDRDRLPPPEVVLHVMHRHGLNRLQAMAEIKSFAESH